MNAPDQGIPRDLLESAKWIAIIPGDAKFAFIFGAITAGDWQPVAPGMAGAPLCLWRLMAGAWGIRSGAWWSTIAMTDTFQLAEDQIRF